MSWIKMGNRVINLARVDHIKIEDEQTAVLYFEGASLRVSGIDVDHLLTQLAARSGAEYKT